jgi:hypothetical protein
VQEQQFLVPVSDGRRDSGNRLFKYQQSLPKMIGHQAANRARDFVAKAIARSDIEMETFGCAAAMANSSRTLHVV